VNEQLDTQEVAYWAEYCGGCDHSPCAENGRCMDEDENAAQDRYLAAQDRRYLATLSQYAEDDG
jgi:hypothetical protein